MSKEQFKVIKKTALQQLIETINKYPNEAKDTEWLLHAIDGLYHEEIGNIKQAYIHGVKDGEYEDFISISTSYDTLGDEYFKKEFPDNP